MVRGIANAELNAMEDFWRHQQLAARRRWTVIDTPAGPVPALLPPGFEPEDEPAMGAVPSVGQHNEAIFRELGLGKGRELSLIHI